jgi:hypothetical protein
MAAKQKMGSLTRANQIIVGDSAVSSVFTLHHWSVSKASVAPSSGPAQVMDKNLGAAHVGSFQRQRRRLQVPLNTRARHVMIKFQESAINFLFRWFLLDETSPTWPGQRQSPGPPWGRPRIATTESKPDHRNRPSPNHDLKVDRFRILIEDFKRLPTDNRRLSALLKCFYLRWFTWTNVVEFVLILLLLGCCAYQCFELLEEYYSYPTHITMTNVWNDNFRIDLPALTICSGNRLSAASIKRNFPHLNRTHFLAISQGTFVSVNNFSVNDERLDSSSSSTAATLPPVTLANRKLSEWQDGSDDYDPALRNNEIHWGRVLRFLTENKPARMHDLLPSGSIIDSLVCANIHGDKIDCEQLARLKSIQHYAKCETLFHESAMWDSDDPRVRELERSIARHPSMLKPSAEDENQELFEFNEDVERRQAVDEMLEEQLKEERLRVDMLTMEVIRLRVRFDAQDYSNPKAEVGARLAIHSSSIIGSIGHKAHQLQPGNWYTFYIDRKDYKRLPPPHSTRCYEYDSNRRHWRERARWLRGSREHIRQLILEQANTSQPIKEYVEALRLRSMGKVSTVCRA